MDNDTFDYEQGRHEYCVAYAHAYGYPGYSVLCPEHSKNPPAGWPALGQAQHRVHRAFCDACIAPDMHSEVTS